MKGQVKKGRALINRVSFQHDHVRVGSMYVASKKRRVRSGGAVGGGRVSTLSRWTHTEGICWLQSLIL